MILDLRKISKLSSLACACADSTAFDKKSLTCFWTQHTFSLLISPCLKMVFLTFPSQMSSFSNLLSVCFLGGGDYNPLLSRFPFLLLSAQLFYFLFSSKETVPYFYLSLNSSNDQYVLNLVVVFFKICTVTMHKSHLKTQFIVYYFRTVKQPAEDFRGWWNRYVNPVTLTWYWSACLMTTSISETLCKNMEDGIYILQTFSMNYCYLYSLEENNREKKNQSVWQTSQLQTK